MPIRKSMARDVKALPESELTLMARAREATGRYAWTPYMHDPKLKGRLHRIGIPTLVLWGEADRVASPDYGRSFAAAIPGRAVRADRRRGPFPASGTAGRAGAPHCGFCRGVTAP